MRSLQSGSRAGIDGGGTSSVPPISTGFAVKAMPMEMPSQIRKGSTGNTPAMIPSTALARSRCRDSNKALANNRVISSMTWR